MRDVSLANALEVRQRSSRLQLPKVDDREGRTGRRVQRVDETGEEWHAPDLRPAVALSATPVGSSRRSRLFIPLWPVVAGSLLARCICISWCADAASQYHRQTGGQYEDEPERDVRGNRHRNSDSGGERRCPDPAFARSTRGGAQAEHGRKPEAPSPIPVDRDDGHQPQGRREVAKATACLLRSRWKADEGPHGRAQAGCGRLGRRGTRPPWRRTSQGKHHREQERRNGGVHGKGRRPDPSGTSLPTPRAFRKQKMPTT